jgi:hypothetical protein
MLLIRLFYLLANKRLTRLGEKDIMAKKFKRKGFIISVIGRDFRKTPEPEEICKDGVPGPASPKEDSGKSQILKKDRIPYRIEYTKNGPKFWTLH